MKKTFALVTDADRLMASRALGMARADQYMVICDSLRSKDQNSKTHAWYQEIAQALPESDANGWKRYCKLHHGVPILRAEDAEFKAFYDAAMKRALNYEQKLQAMDFVPVTSIMTKGQLSRYFDAVQADFFNKGVELL
jgi:hypothetical protein